MPTFVFVFRFGKRKWGGELDTAGKCDHRREVSIAESSYMRPVVEGKQFYPAMPNNILVINLSGV
jgi:hypothetical protein